MTDSPAVGTSLIVPMAKWAWRAVAVLPGSTQTGWKLLREAPDGTAEFHIGTYPMELHATAVEGYRLALMMEPPSVFVALNQGIHTDNPHGIDLHQVTPSAEFAQQFLDSGELIVDPVPMPPALVATVQAFCDAHYVETPFTKRRRGGLNDGPAEDGRGDPRIRQAADVYRSPGAQKPKAGA